MTSYLLQSREGSDNFLEPESHSLGTYRPKIELIEVKTFRHVEKPTVSYFGRSGGRVDIAGVGVWHVMQM